MLETTQMDLPEHEGRKQYFVREMLCPSTTEEHQVFSR